jgi:hypothetical protein
MLPFYFCSPNGLTAKIKAISSSHFQVMGQGSLQQLSRQLMRDIMQQMQQSFPL